MIADHGGNVFEISNLIKIPANRIIDFSSSINPFGPPSNVIDSIKNHLDLIKLYPDRKYSKLREALANYLEISSDGIIVGCGTTELIHSILARFVRNEVIIPLPNFSEYEAAAKALDLNTIFIHPYGIKINFNDLINFIDKASPHGAIVLCNPNNPTGEVLESKKIIEVIERAEDKGIIVILDEAYHELSEEAESLIKRSFEFSNLFVLRSLTKPFGFPGLRVGYCICHPNLAKKFEATAISWRVGILEEIAAISAINDKDFLKFSKERLTSAKKRFFESLKSIDGLKPIDSGANFFMIDISNSGFSPRNLKWRLLSYALLIRDLTSVKGLPNIYIRVATRREEENLLLLEALDNIINSMKKIYPNNPICMERKCHKYVFDCRLCFCPFYPCLDETTGGKFIERETEGIVWSCIDCTWVHRVEVADKILEELADIDIKKVDPEAILRIKRQIMEEFQP
ncbi:MAG: aminotransferase class I/II-fold pyridoxal phosphate-dependent enzyme [Candidatus Methanomethyliaceae archaeon]|nr:aminotransferase class I/II-fold pyridoxal phosphate-dependent enzyme [Candidatus Methanomethyliaceae archaeon]MDW7970295.1 aminotransferase class I/II-fold pyridoxal phosphate-dependent enzyme [Nitrososphaerota archaeon]